MISDTKMTYLLSNIAPFLLKVKRKSENRRKKTASPSEPAEKNIF